MATLQATVAMQPAPTMSTSSSASSVGIVKPMILPHAAAAAVAAAHDPASLPVRKLTLADIPRAVNCLCAAFSQDQVARYFTHGLPDATHWPESRRWAVHMDIMKCLVKAHVLRGLVTGIGASQPIIGPGSQKSCFVPADPLNPTQAESFDAVALWMPPESDMDDLITTIRSGLWRLYVKLSKEGRKRFFTEFFPLLHETKLEVFGSHEADIASWYLVYLGARPGARGKGCAGRIMKAVTEKICDVEGRQCYLESSNKANLKLYGRLGFEYIKTISLKRDEASGLVEMDIMVRKPKGRKTSQDGQPSHDEAVSAQ